MKLFKKLAAAVLVAALALMMVGCGGSKTGLAQQVKNAVSDDAVMRGEQATDSKDLDALAANLLTEINNAIAESEEGKWPDLQDLLDDETFLQKFGIDPEKDAYKVSLVYVPSYISDTMNQFKPFSLADQLRRDADHTIGDPHIGRKFEFGLAIGTLDGENWVLMLMK
jgi:polyhydroxyalkanoate synthesis regulator phasin